MRKRRSQFYRLDGRTVAIALIVLLFVVLLMFPLRTPPDLVREMHFSTQFAGVQRLVIGPGQFPNRAFFSSGKRGIRSFPPRAITLTSDGAPFRAYLLDLSAVDGAEAKVQVFMNATTEIEQGRDPASAAVAAKEVDVTEARFQLDRSLGSFFISDALGHMLIVQSDGDAVVTVRVSY